MPAWGDIVNSLLLNRQKLQENQLNMMDTAMNIMGKQEALQENERLRNIFSGAALLPPDTQREVSSPSDFGNTFDMSNPLAVQYKRELETQNANKRMAAIYKQSGGRYGLTQAEKYDALVQQGETNLREMASKLYDTRQKRILEASQVMQDVKDRDSLISAADYVVRNYEPSVAQKILSGINFNRRDGLPIYDDSAARAIKNLNAEYKNAHEKATEKQAADNLAETKSNHEQVHKDKLFHEGQANARAANAQSGAMQRFVLAYNAKDDKQATEAEKTANNDLNKNELVKNFPKYAQAFEAAKNVNRQMTTGGLRDTAAPDIQNMVRGYEQAINNFRSFMGGKWSAQQTDRMQGTLQNVRTYFETIGQGKKPDKALVAQIANETARVYQDTNAAVLKQTLELRERAWKKRGDPTAVVSPAQMSEVIRTGRGDLIIDPDNGQQMMAFRQSEDYGKDPKKVPIKKPLPENIVPIYDKPKEDKRKAVLRGGKLVLEEPTEAEE